MRWIIGVDRKQAAAALGWVKALAAQFDLSRVAWIRIDMGRGRYRGVYGRCWWPTKKLPMFRISCQVPGPYPTVVQTVRKPLYPGPDGRWPPVPKGCHVRGYGRDPRTGRVWLKLGAQTLLRDINEGIVWIFGHELYHFLRQTRQIAGRNTEAYADEFADWCLLRFRCCADRPPAAASWRSQ